MHGPGEIVRQYPYGSHLPDGAWQHVAQHTDVVARHHLHHLLNLQPHSTPITVLKEKPQAKVGSSQGRQAVTLVARVCSHTALKGRLGLA